MSSGTNKVIRRANPSSLHGKFLVGYQGWFTCAGDGEPIGAGHHGWLHWFNYPIPHGGRPNLDLWPDVSAYDPSELYDAPGLTKRNGEQVKLFSSRNAATVQRHFHWMAEHSVDGAFLQRFAQQVDIDLPQNIGLRNLRDEVGDRVREAAEKEGRVWAIMYDVSGVPVDRLSRILERDWAHLVYEKRILDSPYYLREQGKPVIGLWGLGLDNSHHATHVYQLTRLLRQITPGSSAYIFGGVPAFWRTASLGAIPDNVNCDGSPHISSDVYLECFDAISPWTVGRFKTDKEAELWGEGRMKFDAECINKWNEERGAREGRKVDYIPVVLPGGSGYNLSQGQWAFNDIPRRGGRFLWQQIFNAKRVGAHTIYGAMWDEYDEGTAFMPAVEHKYQLPQHDTYRFMALDEDGHDVSADWYMRICGFASEALKGERRIYEGFPSKELSDYWSSRPKYEDAASASGSSSGAGSSSQAGPAAPITAPAVSQTPTAIKDKDDGETYEQWLASQKDEKDDEPPPAYTLEEADAAAAAPAPAPAPARPQVPAQSQAPLPQGPQAAIGAIPAVAATPVTAASPLGAQPGPLTGPPAGPQHGQGPYPAYGVGPTSSGPSNHVPSGPVGQGVGTTGFGQPGASGPPASYGPTTAHAARPTGPGVSALGGNAPGPAGTYPGGVTSPVGPGVGASNFAGYQTGYGPGPTSVTSPVAPTASAAPGAGPNAPHHGPPSGPNQPSAYPTSSAYPNTGASAHNRPGGPGYPPHQPHAPYTPHHQSSYHAPQSQPPVAAQGGPQNGPADLSVDALAQQFGRQNLGGPVAEPSGPGRVTTSPPPVHPASALGQGRPSRPTTATGNTQPGPPRPTAQGRPQSSSGQPQSSQYGGATGPSLYGPATQNVPQGGYNPPAPGATSNYPPFGAPVSKPTLPAPAQPSTAPQWPPQEWTAGGSSGGASLSRPSTFTASSLYGGPQGGANLRPSATIVATSNSSPGAGQSPTSSTHNVPPRPSTTLGYPGAGSSTASSIPAPTSCSQPPIHGPPNPSAPLAGGGSATSSYQPPATGYGFPSASPAASFPNPSPNWPGAAPSQTPPAPFGGFPAPNPQPARPPYGASGGSHGTSPVGPSFPTSSPYAPGGEGYFGGGMPSPGAGPGGFPTANPGYNPAPNQPYGQPTAMPGPAPGHHGGWAPAGAPPAFPPRPTGYGGAAMVPVASSSSNAPNSNLMGGALGYALNTVDKYAGKKTREQLESGIGSLASSSTKLFGKFSKP